MKKTAKGVPVGTAESRIVLGAAVIDDVLGLIVLATVTGAIAASNGGARFSAWSVLGVVLKALGFLIAAVQAADPNAEAQARKAMDEFMTALSKPPNCRSASATRRRS